MNLYEVMYGITLTSGESAIAYKSVQANSFGKAEQKIVPYISAIVANSIFYESYFIKKITFIRVVKKTYTRVSDRNQPVF